MILAAPVRDRCAPEFGSSTVLPVQAARVISPPVSCAPGLAAPIIESR